MSTEIRIPPASTERQSSPDVHNTMNVAGSNLLLGFFAVACIAALCFSIHAIGRADAAGERARLAERETRIMQADLQYVRAWATARGVYLPANHEEAEEKDHFAPNHHQRPEHTLASAAGSRARGAEQHGVLLSRGPR